MQQLLNFIRKNFPKTYNRLKKSKRLNDLLNFWASYKYLFNFILKRDKSLLRFFIKTTFTYYILRNKSDITFEYKGNQITMPRHLKGIDGFIEVRGDGFYDKIKGYKNVLDLGGYIGDSALKFAKNNKNVSVYEAHPDNFKYLQINTKNLQNVMSYNKAVVGHVVEKTIKFYGGGFNMGAGTGHVVKGNDFVEAPVIGILDILKQTKFDALKMDIEGAEYDCFDAIIKSKENVFLFKEGFIEFHLGEDRESDLDKIRDIISRLGTSYKFDYYDALSNKPLKGVKEFDGTVLLVHFYK